MSDENRTPREAFDRLKDKISWRARLEKQVRDCDAAIAESTAALTSLFTLGVERRFRVGHSWDPTFVRATLTTDGLVLKFEDFEDLDSLKFPEPDDCGADVAEHATADKAEALEPAQAAADF